MCDVVLLTAGQGSEDEYDVPPCSAQGSSAGHSAPRSPLPPDTGHGTTEFESGSSIDSVVAEPGSSMETCVVESEQAGKLEKNSILLKFCYRPVDCMLSCKTSELPSCASKFGV